MLPLEIIPGATGHETFLIWLCGIGFVLMLAALGLFWRTFDAAQAVRFGELETSISRRFTDLSKEVDEVKQAAIRAFDANAAEHKEFAETIARHDVVYRVAVRRWLNGGIESCD